MTGPELLSGLGLGLAIAVPIGPMAILCIGRSLGEGVAAGVATGLGAACIHALFGIGAAIGLDALAESRIAAWGPHLSTAGALILFVFAGRLLKRKADMPSPEAVAARRLPAMSLSAALLGLTSPTTILLLVASLPIFVPSGTRIEPLPFAIGIFAGSFTWWLTLAVTIGALRRQFSATAIRSVNNLAAVALAAFGATLLARNASDVLPSLSAVPLADHFGFVGGAMTLLAFAQTQMLRMRLAAIAANGFFIAFGLLAPALPVLALHVVLLPLNVHRLAACLAAERLSRRAWWLRSPHPVRAPGPGADGSSPAQGAP